MLTLMDKKFGLVCSLLLCRLGLAAAGKKSTPLWEAYDFTSSFYITMTNKMHCTSSKGAIIRYWGGGVKFLPVHFFHKRDGKLYFVLPHERLEIFISIFILYLFQPPFTFVDKIFISTMPCGHLFISSIFPHKKPDPL